MAKAPKKIWLHEGFWRSGDSDYWTDEEGTDPKYRIGDHYIRADIVEEMRELLMEYAKVDEYFGRSVSAHKTKTVLKRLEEE